MTVVEEACRIAPEIKARAAGSDELRRQPDVTWKQLMEGGLVRALQPKRWGGGEVTLLDFIDATMEISKASASTGWVMGVIGVHPWQLALFEEQAQDELWGPDPTRMHSSSYAPTGTAEKVPGGYQVSGRWSFSSGCDHCVAVNLGAFAGTKDVDGVEIPDLRSFLLFRDQYQVEDNWFTAGMKGTGSKDIVVEPTFVPEYRTQSHIDYAFNRPLPGQEKNDGTLYRLPWSVVFNFALAASVFGAAQGFVDTWIEHSRPRFNGLSGPVRDDKLMQQRLAIAMWDLDAAVAKIRRDTVEVWEMAEANEPVPPELRSLVRWNANRGAEVVGRAVSELFHSASGRSIYLGHELQRGFQDVHGMLGHAFLTPDPHARAVGGAALGTTAPEWVM